jgi:hypothetical protein
MMVKTACLPLNHHRLFSPKRFCSQNDFYPKQGEVMAMNERTMRFFSCAVNYGGGGDDDGNDDMPDPTSSGDSSSDQPDDPNG